MSKRFYFSKKHILHFNQKIFFIFITVAIRMFFTLKVQKIKKLKIKHDRPLVVVSNHISIFDGLIIPCVLGASFFFTLKKLWGFPAFHGHFNFLPKRLFLKFIGAFPIKREETLEKSLEGTLKALDENLSLFFFPEGKRTVVGEKSKPGRGIGYLLKKKKVYVLPVYIRYSVRGKNGFGARPGRVWLNVGKVVKSEYFVENFSDETRHEEIFRQIHALSDLRKEKKSWSYRFEEMKCLVEKFLFKSRERIAFKTKKTGKTFSANEKNFSNKQI